MLIQKNISKPFIKNYLIMNNLDKESKEIRDFFSILSISNSTKDLSTKELKKLISNLENEKEVYEMIIQIESYLIEMKPTVCDFNYHKYISLLFEKMKKINNKDEQIFRFTHIFLQLRRIFPGIENYLESYNKDNIIINNIHNMDNVHNKILLYCLYTKNFSSFDNISTNDIIKIFHFYFYYVLLKMKGINFLLLEKLSLLIILLCKRNKDHRFTHNKVGKIEESPYLILIIETYIDMCIYYIMKALLEQKLFSNTIKKIINMLGSLFSSYIEINSQFPCINKEIIQKVMLILCYLLSYSLKLNDSIVKEIINTCLLLYSLDQRDILHFLLDIIYNTKDEFFYFTKEKIEISYFRNVIDIEGNERKSLLEKSYLNQIDNMKKSKTIK